MAVEGVNGQVGLSTIDFSIGSGPATILLSTPLPAITQPVIIDGTSQPGFAGTPLVVVSGANIPVSLNNIIGLDIQGGGSTIKGLVINSFQFGEGSPSSVELQLDSNNNVVTGNYIGTDATGTLPGGNDQEFGVLITNTTHSGNTIGGTTAAARNIISGESDENVSLDGSENVVEGNYIGTDVSGTKAVTPTGGAGVFARGPNVIGGTIPGAANVISGNGDGVQVNGGLTNPFIGAGPIVEGNRIGVNATGTAAIPNARAGVNILGANDTIGGPLAGEGNLISGNATAGVLFQQNAPISNNLIQGNLIGTDASGTVGLGNGLDGIQMFGAAQDNTIGGTLSGAGNVISGNARYGILLFDSTVTGNLIEGNAIGTTASGSASLPNGANGLNFYGASGNTVGGTVAGAGNTISGNAFFGILMGGATPVDNVIEGNAIGTNSARMAGLANGLDGVYMATAASNVIGGSAAGAGNIISGNARFGLFLFGNGTSSNVVQGNSIGTNLLGTTAIPNGAVGVILGGGATNNTLGGTTTGAANTISGNSVFGVEVTDVGTSGNVIEGNHIGTNSTGTTALGNALDGVDVLFASGNTIGGTATGAGNVISSNARFGIFVAASHTVIQGNLVGTDAAGSVALANVFDGLVLGSGAANNTVGGFVAGAGNVFSGNDRFGIYLLDVGTNNNIVQGNIIGLNRAGTAKVGNGVDGVEILLGAAVNMIGGFVAGSGNVISGNGRNGVVLGSGGTVANLVEGNFIGTDVSGTLNLGNASVGVAAVTAASSNIIGGVLAGTSNDIAFNGSAGVVVGTIPADAATTGDAVEGNAIYDNVGLGIDLGNNGVTPNGSGPNGPNHFQNHPTISGVFVGGTTITATVSFTSVPSSTFRLEFFFNPTTDASPQGRTFLGAVSVTTDTNGNLATATALTAGVTVGTVNTGNNTVSVTLPLPANTTAGALTATATVLSVGTGQTASVGDTSEFSAAAPFGP
jgi:titin